MDMGDSTSLLGDLLLGGAFVATQITALRLAERAGLESCAAFWLTVAGAAGALVGGSLWSAMASAQPLRLEQLLSGERGAIGAALGALVAALAFLSLTRRPVFAYIDAMLPAAFLGYAIARIACLVEGHCFGVVTEQPFAITYPPGTSAYAAQLAAGLIGVSAERSLAVHPTQLYHAALGLAAFFILVRSRGSRLALALALYGSGRFALEFLRGDMQPIIGPLSANHLACIAMVIAALVLWARSRARPRLLFVRRTA